MTAKLNSRFFSANAIIVIALMMLVYTIYSWVTPYAHDDYMFSRYYLDGNNHQESFSLTGLFNLFQWSGMLKTDGWPIIFALRL